MSDTRVLFLCFTCGALMLYSALLLTYGMILLEEIYNIERNSLWASQVGDGMNSKSQKTLQRVYQDDTSLIELRVCHSGNHGFNSMIASDFDRLGKCIGKNEHVKKMVVHIVDDTSALDVQCLAFFDGLKSNSSIHDLSIGGDNGHHAIDGVARAILNAYQANNSHLTKLDIHGFNLQNGGEDTIATTLRSCTHLTQVSIVRSNITDEHIVPVVKACTGYPSLTSLNLSRNSFGTRGCKAIAELLQDSNSNVESLHLSHNHINTEDAITLANSLVHNTRVKSFYLYPNPINRQGQLVLEDIFSNLLCNTTSINSIHSSNHTLQKFDQPSDGRAFKLLHLLNWNKRTNKKHVAIIKILQYHPYIDMKPFFGWDLEGEESLKALPYVLAFFERARAPYLLAVPFDIARAATDGDEASYDLKQRKLSAIYQFARAMPLLFVPANRDKKV